ncbi:MAG TPA: hypothetical protein VHG72_10505 [Polyangia bacterium]|nr:hypothetical protein [Polyangia bacterium]
MSGRLGRRHLVLVAAGGIALLAVVETAVALVEPALAPSDTDWQAAAAAVRAGFRPGDLIVAAPAWADPVLRQHLGDLIPAEVAARMDDDRFARVWEVSQRGGRAAAAAGGTVARDQRFGRLRVRLVEHAAETVTYDFVAHLAEARVSRRDARGADVACALSGDRVSCPEGGSVPLRRQIAEVDQKLRAAVLTQPFANAALVIEFPAVALGRSLVIATGLHDTWLRKAARGTVEARLTVGAQTAALPVTDDDSGWTRTRVDTAAQAGQTVPVRLEITSAQPRDRAFAFAAEARR